MGLGISLLIGCPLSHATEVPIDVKINASTEMVSLEFQGREEWIYEVQEEGEGSKSKKKISLVVETLDPQSQATLAKFKNEFIDRIEISLDSQRKTKLEIFPNKKFYDKIESFHYQTDQPSRLVFDLYLKDVEKFDEASKSASKKTQKEKLEEQKPNKPGRVEPRRAPAEADFLTVQSGPESPSSPISAKKTFGVFDGADQKYDRFRVKEYEISQSAINKSRANYYMAFPMFEIETPAWTRLKSQKPIYQIRRDKTPENLEARLLLQLKEKKKYLVFQKTLKWFRDKYPNSKYNEVLKFAEADVEYELYQDTKKISRLIRANQLYRECIEHYPSNPQSERMSLLLGIRMLEQKDYLAALRLFQEHLDRKDLLRSSPLAHDLARLGMMQVYERMKRESEALSVAEYLEKNSLYPEVKAEAQFRRGDVFFRSKNFERSIKEYQGALTEFPHFKNEFPGALFNQAEAYFWLKDYRSSLERHREFISEFPSADHGALSMTRISDLMEIFGLPEERVQGPLLEAQFRFGENPKSILARMKLLASRIVKMRPKEAKTASQSILDLAKKLDWPDVDSYANLMTSDALSARGDFDQSTELLTRFYQENPTNLALPLYRMRIISNINDSIFMNLNKNDFISALKAYDKNSDHWLKSGDRLDTIYLVGRSFEMAGVYSQAEKHYKETLNKYYATLGTAQEKDLEIFKHLPSLEVINLRLARVKFEVGDWNKSQDYVKLIKKPEAMSEADQVERLSLMADLYEKRGDPESARRFLSEMLSVWQGQPALLAELYLQLARLEKKLKQEEQALKSLKKIIEFSEDSGEVKDKFLVEAYRGLIDHYEKNKDMAKAAETLQAFLEKFEDKISLASQRYRLGLIQFNQGQLQKAAETWAQLDRDQTRFWSNLAQERLRDAQWQNDYKKYIRRIPAMENSESR